MDNNIMHLYNINGHFDHRWIFTNTSNIELILWIF